MNTQRTKKLLARFILRCFRCFPWSLLLVGDVSSLGVDFSKTYTTPWLWFTSIFAGTCIALSVLGLAVYAVRGLIGLYDWAEENE